jgi:hypothetical protein
LNTSSPRAARQAPVIEVSWGELVDKLTILEIKEQRLSSPAAVANVRHELAVLRAALQGVEPAAQLAELKAKLTAVNEKIWQIEDDIRAKEAVGTFDQGFIQLARGVYFNNDKRADLKREINQLLNSALVEEKQHPSYRAHD